VSMTWLALRVNGRASEGPVVSAVIYAAIVVMWAVVLVPMWLRRHDAATESRSAERFSTAMRTLSRRTHATPGRRYVVMPRRQAGSVSIHVSGAAVTPTAATEPDGRPARSAATAARAAMVRRRRRTTFVLLGLVTLTAVLMAAGMFPWPLQLAIDLVLVAFVVHLRTQARRAAAVARQRRQATVAAARPARPARSVPAVPVPAAPIADPVPALPAATVDVTWSDADTSAAVVEAEISVEETWEPVPVPRPTYTFMPPAPSPAAAAYDSDATEEMAPVVDDVPTDLDEILERRRAVND
jgi:hypothetical protein